MMQIVKAASNNTVRSESDKNWFLLYENIRVGKPSKTEDMITQVARCISFFRGLGVNKKLLLLRLLNLRI